jgi:hypothetical protein
MDGAKTLEFCGILSFGSQRTAPLLPGRFLRPEPFPFDSSCSRPTEFVYNAAAHEVNSSGDERKTRDLDDNQPEASSDGMETLDGNSRAVLRNRLGPGPLCVDRRTP